MFLDRSGRGPLSVLSCVTRRARHEGKTVGGDDDGVPAPGAETIAGAVHLMSQLYATAMREVPPIVSSNPFAALELPAITPHTTGYFEHDEAAALFDAIEQLFGEAARTVVELGMWAGLRPGELFTCQFVARSAAFSESGVVNYRLPLPNTL